MIIKRLLESPLDNQLTYDTWTPLYVETMTYLLSDISRQNAQGLRLIKSLVPISASQGFQVIKVPFLLILGRLNYEKQNGSSGWRLDHLSS